MFSKLPELSKMPQLSELPELPEMPNLPDFSVALSGPPTYTTGYHVAKAGFFVSINETHGPPSIKRKIKCQKSRNIFQEFGMPAFESIANLFANYCEKLGLKCRWYSLKLEKNYLQAQGLPDFQNKNPNYVG
jgi:hypothetical protein